MRKLTIIACLAYLIPLLIWWFSMGLYQGYELSFKNEDWGAFGSFFGGVLSPLFGLISIVFLYISIQKSDKNHQTELNVLKAHNRREHLIKFIEIYTSKLDEPIKNQFSDILNKPKIDVNVYNDNSHQISFPDGTIREAILQFYSSKSPDKRHSKDYLDLMGTLTANVELCFCKILDLAISIEDSAEFENIVDLIEALSEFHTTIALFEFSLSQITYSNESPVLERMSIINERTNYCKELVTRYQKCKKMKASG